MSDIDGPKALAMLDEAKSLSAGFWIDHSLNVGQAARLIAEKCAGMDVDKAYAFGLLHDIGRRFQGKIQVGTLIIAWRRIRIRSLSLRRKNSKTFLWIQKIPTSKSESAVPPVRPVG